MTMIKTDNSESSEPRVVKCKVKLFDNSSAIYDLVIDFDKGKPIPVGRKRYQEKVLKLLYNFGLYVLSLGYEKAKEKYSDRLVKVWEDDVCNDEKFIRTYNNAKLGKIMKKTFKILLFGETSKSKRNKQNG